MQTLVDDNPAVTEFRYLLALNRRQPRRPAVGQAVGGEYELRKAIALLQKVADDNPAVIYPKYGAWPTASPTSLTHCRGWAS